MKTFLKIITCLALMFVSIDAQTLYKSSPIVNLKWTANTESNIDGYYIGYGTTLGEYTTKTPLVKTNNIVIPSLEVGKTYYMVVYAVNTYKLVSQPSPAIKIEIVDKGFPLNPTDVTPVIPTRYVDILQSLDGGVTYKSIGMVPYPVIPDVSQRYKSAILKDTDGLRYVNILMSIDGGVTYTSIGKVLYPLLPNTTQRYKTAIIKV